MGGRDQNSSRRTPFSHNHSPLMLHHETARETSLMFAYVRGAEGMTSTTRRGLATAQAQTPQKLKNFRPQPYHAH